MFLVAGSSKNRVLWDFFANTKPLEKGLKNVQGGFKDTERQSSKMQTAFGGITRAAGAVGLALGGRELLTWAGDALQMGIAAEEVESKFQAVFGSADDLRSELTSLGDMAGITETDMNDLAATFGNLAQSVGLPDEEVETLTVDIATLAADMASFNDSDPAEVFRTLNTAVLTAERDGLKKYGISVSENEVKTRALEIAVKAGRTEFDKADKALASYQLIAERAGKANGDLERTQDSLANKQRQLTASVEEMKEAFGKELVKVLATTAEGIDTQTDSLKTLGTVLGTGVRKWLEPYAEAVVKTGTALDTSKSAADRFGAAIGAVDAYIRASIPPIQWLADGIDQSGRNARDAALEMEEYKKGIEATTQAIQDSKPITEAYIAFAKQIREEQEKHDARNAEHVEKINKTTEAMGNLKAAMGDVPDPFDVFDTRNWEGMWGDISTTIGLFNNYDAYVAGFNNDVVSASQALEDTFQVGKLTGG